MNNKAQIPPSIGMLKVKMATNHFKRLLLGDLHLPGQAQESAAFDELDKVSPGVKISTRTWNEWFLSPDITPQVGKLITLDLTAAKIPLSSKNGFRYKARSPNAHLHMIRGGLVSAMMRSSKSKHPLIALMDRAEIYQPDSALHLHLDAIEVSALSEGYGKIPWDTVKRVGAERILRILAERWGPRHGSIYSELSSDLRLKWDAATRDERSEIRKSLGRFRPDPFESILNARAVPNWDIAGIEADVAPQHIYKALFSLAADVKFLVADRLEAWSLDLATAALAMHSLAWTDRLTFFGPPISDELIYWCALEDLLFSTELIDTDNQDFVGAMSLCAAEWSMESFDVFLRARKTYQDELHEHGISVKEITEIAMQATKTHPLVLRS